MTLETPQALLWAVPLALLVALRQQPTGLARGLRVAVLVVMVLALSGPACPAPGGGADVVVVVDRSGSMPAGSDARAEELIRLLEGERREHDRLAVVSFGQSARIETPLSSSSHFGGFTAAIDPNASNLSGALELCEQLLPEGRAGRVLVLSDGWATGPDARAAARRLAARGIAVDVRPFAKSEQPNDAAVLEVTVPPSVYVKEPFLLSATLKANRATTATVTLERDGVALARLNRTLGPTPQVVTFRDAVERPGVVRYQVRLASPNDSVPENDVGRAVLRVEGSPRVLLLTDSPSGTLAKALAEVTPGLEVRTPGPLSFEALDGVQAVVLENVEAGRLTERGLEVLASFVREAGGGLVLTGGRHALGEGGYRRSALEEALPVSLELREEQRKAAIAMSIIMDCSCSMGATVPDGRTKMQLAAEGVVGAVQLLTARDELAVAMVDTEVHELMSMASVGEGVPYDAISGGFSGGGGIFVGVGLREAQRQVLRSTKPTRHVLLFSDAADSEEPEDYQRTLEALTKQGVTVSVIGMGTPADPDAQLLQEIAALGKGRMYFAEDAMSLPRIFSQETIAVARASFVDVATSSVLTSDVTQLGQLGTASGPQVGGYNLTYAKPAASVALRSVDENAAPLVAFWPHGRGKAVVLAVEVDGEHTGGFRQWGAQRALLGALLQWSMPAPDSARAAVAGSQLISGRLHLTLDVDPHAPLRATPTAKLLSGDGRRDALTVTLHWEDDDRAGAWVDLEPGTVWHPVITLGTEVYRAPPVTLPWAPELAPGAPAEGVERLTALATAGHGVERHAMTGLFTEGAQSMATRSLTPWLVGLVVALLLSEVLARRLWSGTWRRQAAAPRPPPREAPTEAAAPVDPTATAPTAQVGAALTTAAARAQQRTKR